MDGFGTSGYRVFITDLKFYFGNLYFRAATYASFTTACISLFSGFVALPPFIFENCDIFLVF